MITDGHDIDKSKKNLEISVVVPAYNVEGTIDACLDSLLAQTISRDRYEIIVVDNGSTDDTAAKIQTYPVTYIDRPNCTVYGARNEAVQVSTGRILAFIDSDCVADENWLATGLESLHQFDLVTGRVKPLSSPHELLYAYDKYVMRNPLRKIEGEVNIAALNAFILKPVFDALNGFERNLQTAGDSILSMRARENGYTIGYAPSAVVYHPVEGWSHRMRRMMRESYGSKIKASYRWGGIDIFTKTSTRIANAWKLIWSDVTSVRYAWTQREIGSMMAISLLVVAILMRLFTFSSVLSARFFGKLNQKFALP